MRWDESDAAKQWLGLLEAVANLAQGNASSSDRFLEHAYIFALINIGDVTATKHGLSADSFAAQRAALLALDQMPSSALQATDIGPLLSTSDPVLQQTTVEVLARHPEWTKESIQWLIIYCANRKSMTPD